MNGCMRIGLTFGRHATPRDEQHDFRGLG
jgi:hypothetical protein